MAAAGGTEMRQPSPLEARLFRVLWKQTALTTTDEHEQVARACAAHLLRWETETKEEHRA